MRSAALLGGADRANRDGHLPGHVMTYRDAEAPTGRPPGKAPASGHPTARQAGLVGAALGGWLGMLTALLVGVLLPGVTWLPMLPIGLAIGAAAGGALGLVTHWALGKPDSSKGPGPRRAPSNREQARLAGCTAAPGSGEGPVPGLGLSRTPATADRRRIGVLADPSGSRNPICYDLPDDDGIKHTMVLTDIEATTVAQVLDMPEFRAPGARPGTRARRSARAAEPIRGRLTVRRGTALAGGRARTRAIGRRGGRDGCVIASLDRVAARPATRWSRLTPNREMRSPQR